MPYNSVVHGKPYQNTSAIDAVRLSALRAVQQLLQPVDGLSAAHRRELLTISLWKWTEAAGVAPHPKYNVRFATPAALDHSNPAKVNHEHVWPRKWIIDRLLKPGKTWPEPELREFLEEHGVACIVTVEEHARLSALSSGPEGWDRYRRAGLQVRDLTGEGFLDLDQPGASAVVDEVALPENDQSVVLEPGEELAVVSPTEPGLSVDEALDRLSGGRARLLKRLLGTADLAGGVGLVGGTKRADSTPGAYVRVHDATLPEPTRAVAFVHWTGRVSLALSADEVPADLVSRDEVKSQTHKTYGVSCKVSDEGSLRTAEELLVLALEQVRSDFDPAAQEVTDEEPVVQGHVFVVQGTIGQLGADAAIVSTDEDFKVESSWHDLVRQDMPYDPDKHRPQAWPERGWGRDGAGQQIWFLDVTEARTGSTDAFGRLERALLEIAATGLVSSVQGRPLPLVVLPVIGTGLGGFHSDRGTVIDRLLETCCAFVEANPIDLAIVAYSSASFAALQHRRRKLVDQFFTGVDLGRAKELGQRAGEGSLALFIGAGTSIPAGAPSWGGLIDELADEAKFDPQTKLAFDNLSTLDQAELLHAKLDDEMGKKIAKRVEGLTPALAHVLLANLNCQGAVTTNYDRLYEDAVRSTGAAAAAVLPSPVPPVHSRWLLKLHGDYKDPNSIVLTRSQFVGFTGVAGPAGAVVQSLLLTKHVLVVGASMTDDNFLRLIYEVGTYRDRVQKALALENRTKLEPQQFGTILSLSDDPARSQLYRPYFVWEAVPGKGEPARARQLEIFLDSVGMYASNDFSWLLDESFEFLLDEGEQHLAEKVRSLAADVESDGKGDSWSALLEQLERFGAATRRSGRPQTGRPRRNRSLSEETGLPEWASTVASRR